MDQPPPSPAPLPWLSRMLAHPFIWIIWLYRITLSPIIGTQCRYDPTCSRFGLEAYREYGAFKGTWLTAKRIARCHPFAKGGYDPVPPRQR